MCHGEFASTDSHESGDGDGDDTAGVDADEDGDHGPPDHAKAHGKKH